MKLHESAAMPVVPDVARGDGVRVVVEELDEAAVDVIEAVIVLIDAIGVVIEDEEDAL